jgi:hypothetical protein
MVSWFELQLKAFGTLWDAELYPLIGALTEQISIEEVKRRFQAHQLRLPPVGLSCR